MPRESKLSGAVVSDPSGQWVAGHASYGNENRLIVWGGREPREIDLPVHYVMPAGITPTGVVAGSATADRSGSLPGVGRGQFGFVLVGGAFVPLGSPRKGYHATVTGISSTGLVSGWTMTRRGTHQRAYAWSVADPTHPQRFRLPPGWATTYGPSEDGHTAVYVPGEHTRAFVFSPTGTRTELHGTMPNLDVTATAIANGWAAGTETDDSGDQHFVRWNLATGQVERVPVNFHSITAVDQHGTVAGEELSEQPFAAALYSDHLIRLPPLEAGHGTVPRSISSGTTAFGVAELPRNRRAAVRWHCD